MTTATAPAESTGALMVSTMPAWFAQQTRLALHTYRSSPRGRLRGMVLGARLDYLLDLAEHAWPEPSTRR